MKTTLVAALALLATGFALVAPAGTANNYACDDAGAISLADQAYVRIDEINGEKSLWSFWIYAESNGAAGLQSGGTTVLGDVDVCQNSSNPDTGIF